ncbi:MAG: ATP-dependent helicase HrpB, partial [Alphaproteobacteria bacterium HGW-Alphaproteobacteria-2]
RQSLAGMAARAYPDRIGSHRAGDAPRFVLSGGRGAVVGPGDALGAARLVVATDLDGGGAEARIRQGVAISEAELRGLFSGRIEWVDVCRWSRRARRVEARRQERLGALVLDDRIWRDCPPERLAGAALEGVRDLGLGALDFSRPARLLQARVEFLRTQGEDMPDFSDAGLLAEAEAWLLPFLPGCRTAEDLARLAPAAFIAPTGTRVAIDYGPEGPEIAIRMQEMFGLAEHPCVGPARLPLRITLMSPAQRPLQVTSDLPGFWAASYAEVRRDMRGRYPRHPWPENPAEAVPTRRAKPRGT